MRYLPRQLKTSLARLRELKTEEGNPHGDIRVFKADTKVYKCDFFTKALNCPDFVAGKQRIGLSSTT